MLVSAPLGTASDFLLLQNLLSSTGDGPDVNLRVNLCLNLLRKRFI